MSHAGKLAMFQGSLVRNSVARSQGDFGIRLKSVCLGSGFREGIPPSPSHRISRTAILWGGNRPLQEGCLNGFMAVARPHAMSMWCLKFAVAMVGLGRSYCINETIAEQARAHNLSRLCGRTFSCINYGVLQQRATMRWCALAHHVTMSRDPNFDK